MQFGTQSMIDPLKVVLVRRPDTSFSVDDPEMWGYPARPDLSKAQMEHDEFVAILTAAGVKVVYHDEVLCNLADAIFVRDPAVIMSEGAIIFQMAKKLRLPEADGIRSCLGKLGIPILHQFSGDVFIDGGDLVWIDKHTLAIGQGTRTGKSGFSSLAAILHKYGIRVVPVPLSGTLHLASVCCIVDHNIAVVQSSYLDGSFLDFLRGRGFRLIDLLEAEDATLGMSILTVSPGKCVILESNPMVTQALVSAGCEVTTYIGNEISLKGGGGALCLTLPILREV
jgi:N-dimethylarginine dimethylaminohydrolase